MESVRQPDRIEIKDIVRLIGDMPDIQIDVRDFINLMQEYRASISEIRTKFEIFDEDSKVRLHRYPIHAITSRLKSPASLLDKLRRKGLPLTLDNVRSQIFDVAGVRVVCNYLEDIRLVAEALLRQDDISLIRYKDYVGHPKESGYRSLHLVVSVPVFLSDHRSVVPVEVQLRTIAMDFWASLEHSLRYKNDEVLQTHGPEVDNIRRRLVGCADSIAAIDKAMQKIRVDIDQLADEQDLD